MNTHMEKRCTKYQAVVVDKNKKVLMKQKTIEGYGSNLGLTKFSAEECRRALVEMLILDELPFGLLRIGAFVSFVKWFVLNLKSRLGEPLLEVCISSMLIRRLIE
ncbi:hypothetical protein ACOSQ3_027815 [Xanthoceras sorbifolium]